MPRQRLLQAWRRASQLAEMHGQGALSSAPEGQARRFWEAAYPKAFAPLVEKYSQAAGNPPLLLYSIMRKESAYLPEVAVGLRDVGGILQQAGTILGSARAAEFRTLAGRPTEYQSGIPQALTLMNGTLIGSATDLAGSQNSRRPSSTLSLTA